MRSCARLSAQTEKEREVRVVILAEGFTKMMGYTENNLPKALALLGHEVHVVTTNLQANYRTPDYRDIYESFLGPVEQPCGTEILDGYALHRLPHAKPLGYARIRGLTKKLRSLRPDVVQALAVASWIPLEAALARRSVGYRLFTGAHQTASVFPKVVKEGSRWCAARLKSDVRRALPGRIVSFFSEKCYAATVDCAEIAEKYYGVPKQKIDVCPIGVDTDLFRPADDHRSEQARTRLRESLGFEASHIVCIYTGRFSEAKNPLCLAQAVRSLVAQGEPYRGLFIGDGPQADAIAVCDGCAIRSFVPWARLAEFYRAADIGVWPTQESMSMLDATACGLPTVVSDRLRAVERVEGNGLTYREGDPADLSRALISLKATDDRQRLGRYGSEKIRRHFSWIKIAERRLRDYEAAVGRPASG